MTKAHPRWQRALGMTALLVSMVIPTASRAESERPAPLVAH